MPTFQILPLRNFSGFGGGIHGCAQIQWNQYDAASPVCYCQGKRRPFVVETVKADDEAKFGRGPSQPAPKFVGNLIAFLLNIVGPKGLEFARYSLDYHTIRNYLHVVRKWGKERLWRTKLSDTYAGGRQQVSRKVVEGMKEWAFSWNFEDIVSDPGHVYFSLGKSDV
ncbi:hypothetical protein H5410_048756 [Solanum commersonii]|uniref:Uncharacterized protein n=1 Tax=Solanum commersonii TaxID=4109 RepID=A0A9J5XKP7_SOLCO|nr:hypothetical protein H5410_048756 [Solanum commersonii]